MTAYTQPTHQPPLYSNTEPLLGSHDAEAHDAPKFDGPVVQTALAIRMAFVRKVYTVLSMQLCLTATMSTVFICSPSIQRFTHSNAWLTFLSLFLSIAAMLALFWKRESYPVNMYLLAVFTTFESYAVANLVTYYDSSTVAMATIITMGVFIGLTLFTMQSSYDFSHWGTYLYVTLWITIVAGFVAMFFPFTRWIQMGYAILGTILFSAYILYDTHMIMQRLSADEYILAAVSLYLDVINLFLSILRLLNAVNSDS
ncbi:Protein lifeguard 4 [Neolecta irregularis DAH-3]|uniref:Protein lifeguard 4 n=1 Tax=Neolecta irregularis (strain DAH-3) TaxID=1198029 RepID=A0A1U7LJA1_NEOID|nr:Protein lifeguard 4 [Neolecta irregularis DAH-3]|eukprot:OLL22724.1 Protein lifeguard 4 [Neolecta irregularis DAH-3]